MDDDSTSPEVSAEGILQCLRMLAEEAAALRLLRTVLALRTAMEVCEVEAAAELFAPEAGESFRAALILH